MHETSPASEHRNEGIETREQKRGNIQTRGGNIEKFADIVSTYCALIHLIVQLQSDKRTYTSKYLTMRYYREARVCVTYYSTNRSTIDNQQLYRYSRYR